MKNINIEIKLELHQKLKVQAASLNITLKEMIRKTLEKGVKRGDLNE